VLPARRAEAVRSAGRRLEAGGDLTAARLGLPGRGGTRAFFVGGGLLGQLARRRVDLAVAFLDRPPARPAAVPAVAVEAASQRQPVLAAHRLEASVGLACRSHGWISITARRQSASSPWQSGRSAIIGRLSSPAAHGCRKVRPIMSCHSGGIPCHVSTGGR